MLGQFLKIDNFTLPNPNPGTFHSNLNPTENSFTMQSGKIKTIPVRLERLSWTGEFNCTSGMLDKLKTFHNLARVNCTFRSVVYSGTLRINGDITLAENSEYTEGTDGLWVVPLIFQSF